MGVMCGRMENVLVQARYITPPGQQGRKQATSGGGPANSCGPDGPDALANQFRVGYASRLDQKSSIQTGLQTRSLGGWLCCSNRNLAGAQRAAGPPDFVRMRATAATLSSLAV